jgi:hypothetical protein
MGRNDVARAQRGARSAVARDWDAPLTTPGRVRTASFAGGRYVCAIGCLRSELEGVVSAMPQVWKQGEN